MRKLNIAKKVILKLTESQVEKMKLLESKIESNKKRKVNFSEILRNGFDKELNSLIESQSR